MAKSNDYLLRIILRGDSGVGKTQVLTRFCEEFGLDISLSTIGWFKLFLITFLMHIFTCGIRCYALEAILIQ